MSTDDDIERGLRLVQSGKHAPRANGSPDRSDELEDWYAEPDPPPQGKSGPRTSSNKFIDPHEGLLVRTLARAVMETVTIGFNDVDGLFYTYNDGVWTPDAQPKHCAPAEARIVELLGNRHRDSHISNTLTVIKYQPDTPRLTRDPQPALINVANGMLDWRTGTLSEHSPDYLSTVQLPVEFHPDAQCPAFDEFLTQVMPDAAAVEFMWDVIAYLLYSGNPFHIAILFHGNGRNGKGTLIRVLKALLGTRNISDAALHDLVENRFRTATLYGKLANLAGDLDARFVTNTAIFKMVTGGDSIQAENKFGHPFDFTPWATPVYSANKPFGSSDSSEGWTSRWVIVPFPHSFTDKPDRELDDKLQSAGELRGILRKAVERLPALMARGKLPEPPSVAEAKSDFIRASDSVRSWVDEDCVLEPDAWTYRSSLYNTYKTAMFGSGAKLLSDREFYNRLGQIGGITERKSHGTRGFVGIRLRQMDEGGRWGNVH